MTPLRPKTRLHWPSPLHSGQTLTLDREQAAYVTKVLRLKSGAEIGLFNGRDGEWRARLIIDGTRAVQATLGDHVCPPEPASGLTLAFAPIKKAPLEWMLIKATELGIEAFQPLITQHTQGELTRLDRLKTLLVEACEQCERCGVPELHAPLAFQDWLPQAGPIIAALEAGQTRDLRHIGPEQATLLIGPEGGFSGAEITLLEEKATCVSLGPRILKAETAALTLISGVSLARGDFLARPAFRT